MKEETEIEKAREEQSGSEQKAIAKLRKELNVTLDQKDQAIRDLNLSLGEAQSRLEAKEATITVLEESREHLRKKSEQLEREKESLLVFRDHLEEDLTRLRRLLKNKGVDETDLSSYRRELEEEKATLLKAREEFKRTKEDLQNEIDDLKESLKKAKLTIVDAEKEKSSLLSEQRKEAQKEIKEKERETRELRKALEQSSSKSESKEAVIDELKDHRVQLEKRLREAQKGEEAARAAHEDLERSLERQTENSNQLSAELDKAGKELEELRSRETLVEETQRSLKSAQREKEQAVTALQAFSKEVQEKTRDQAAKMVALAKELEKARESLRRKEEENAVLGADLASLREEAFAAAKGMKDWELKEKALIGGMEKLKAAAKRSKEQWSSVSGKIQAEKRGLERELKKYLAKTEKASAEAEAARKELKALKQENAKLSRRKSVSGNGKEIKALKKELSDLRRRGKEELALKEQELLFQRDLLKAMKTKGADLLAQLDQEREANQIFREKAALQIETLPGQFSNKNRKKAEELASAVELLSQGEQEKIRNGVLEALVLFFKRLSALDPQSELVMRFNRQGMSDVERELFFLELVDEVEALESGYSELAMPECLKKAGFLPDSVKAN